MKQLSETLQLKSLSEALKINSKSKVNTYAYHPKNIRELIEIIDKKNRDHKDKDAILDLNDIDVSKITNLSNLFAHIELKKVNMNSWDVSNVTDIHGLFWTNDVIEEIHIEDWDVSNIETVYGAFYFCDRIKELNLDKWDLKKCKEFDLMFKGCEILDTHFTDNWKMPKHAITDWGMFDGCKYVPKWYEKK